MNQNAKLREAILYILSKCENKPTFGKKVLAKLLYFADFNYYKKNYSSITNEPYVRLQYGPFPKHMSEELDAMEKEGILTVEKKSVGAGEHHHYKTMKKGDFQFLTKEELEELHHIISKFGGLNGEALEKLSHEDAPWQVTDPKEIIEYDLVFYRTDEVAQKVE